MSIFKHEQDQVIFISLHMPRIDAKLIKALPHGILIKPNGGVEIKVDSIISELFSINRDKVMSMLNSSKHGVSFAPPLSYNAETKKIDYIGETSTADAARSVARHLSQLGYTMEQLRGYRYYILANENLKIYVVIAGKLSNPPPRAIIGYIQD